MKSFPEFCKEAYDAEFRSGAQIVRTGEGGRVGRERKKTPAEIRRVSQKTDAQGERLPTSYPPLRADAGTKRGSQSQEPTQERGSAAVRERAAAAAKEERRKLAKERAAAKSGGKKPKPKSSDLIKQASKLLSKKSPEVDKRPADQPKRPVVGMSRKERSQITRKGQEKLEKLVRQSEAQKQGIKPEDVKLKNDYRTW